MLEAWIQTRAVANERRSVAEAAPDADPRLQKAMEGLLKLLPDRTATAEELQRLLAPLVPADGRAELAALVRTMSRDGQS
jgi:hypothetical protein